MTAVLAPRPAPAIDPNRSCPRGVYDDGVVTVQGGGPDGSLLVTAGGGHVVVVHGLRPAQVDDELAEPLARALAPHTTDHDVFARAFTGVVVTSRPQADQAWELFYRNSLARIRHRTAPGYATVYRHALELLPGRSLLDLGCGFGFLSLHGAADGRRVTSVEPEPGTNDLLRRAARRLGRGLDVLAADVPTTSLPNGSVADVAVLHVLEHVDAATGEHLLAEALRIARDRVVVAVPYEPLPTALFGHVRTFARSDLVGLGRRLGRSFDVHDHHGGWLVVDPHPR